MDGESTLSDVERAVEIIQKLHSVFGDLDYQVVDGDTIINAAGALKLLGPSPGAKIEAVLVCLANGNPENRAELRTEAPRHLVMEIPE